MIVDFIKYEVADRSEFLYDDGGGRGAGSIQCFVSMGARAAGAQEDGDQCSSYVWGNKKPRWFVLGLHGGGFKASNNRVQ